MRKSQESHRQHSRGAASVVVLVALVGLISAMALAIDTGYMLTTRVQLQNAADAAALAAMGEVRGGLLKGQAVDVAVEIANAHEAGGDPVIIDAGDVEFGSFDYVSRTFSPSGTSGVSAVRVTARRDSSSAQGPLDLFLAPILGRDHADVVASSVAAIGSRDVVMVQDITLSFGPAQPDALDALRDFATTMSDQSIAGDRIGLVSFNEEGVTDQPMSFLPELLADVQAAIDNLNNTWCSGLPFPPCAGTHIGAGVDSAIDTLNAADPRRSSKVIVLVSDGMPCKIAFPRPPLTQEEATRITEERINQALAARDRAADAGISIFSIYLQSQTDPQFICQGSEHLVDFDFLRQMTTGFGQYFETPDAEDLDDILVSILTETPLNVVQ